MVSKGRKSTPLVQVEHDPAKFSKLDILTTTVPINKYHGETSVSQNSAQRSMVPEATNGVSANTDKPRWWNSNRFDYLEPLVLPLGIIAMIEYGIIFLLLVVP